MEKLDPNRENYSVQIIFPGPDDWQVLRDIKINSIKEEDIAFADADPELKKYLDRQEESWKDNLSRADRLFVFAKKGENWVGMVSAIIDQDQKSALVQHMYVQKIHRGENIGEKLLQSLLEKFKQKGIEVVRLEVLETQLPAINLYHKLGFNNVRVSSQTAERGDQKYNEIEMELKF